MAGNQSVQQTVYAALRQSINSLRLEPGTTMSTQEIATRLHVSRTPVREAFLQLEREGMLLTLPQCTRVSKMNPARIRQEHFMRSALEQAVLEPFLRRHTFEHLKEQNRLVDLQMTAQMERQYEELIQYDDEFHRIFFVGAGQQLSWDTLQGISTHYRRFRLLTLRDYEISKTIVMQHIELLRAVEAGNLERGKNLLKEHLAKIQTEESELLQTFPDYFDREEDKIPFTL